MANAEMKLYNLTMKVNRLEMLKSRLGLALVEGYDKVEKSLAKGLNKRVMDEFTRRAGIYHLNAIPSDRIYSRSRNKSACRRRLFAYCKHLLMWFII